MDIKRDLTKELLAHCFRELMLTTPFDKITIKMITDRAGLIRPTFYKHFQDKYEVLEWIFRTDVTDSVDLMLDNHMETDAIVMFCRCIERDKRFYKRAYQMDPGPNSFDSLVETYARSKFLALTQRFQLLPDNTNSFLTREVMAEYYTSGMVSTIRRWVVSDLDVSGDEIAAACHYLFAHSMRDMMNLKSTDA